MIACRTKKHGLVGGAFVFAAFANPASAKLLLDSYTFDLVTGNSPGSGDYAGAYVTVEVDLYTLGTSLSDPGTLAEVTTVSYTENGNLYLTGGQGQGVNSLGLIVNGAVTVTDFRVTNFVSDTITPGAANVDAGNQNQNGVGNVSLQGPSDDGYGHLAYKVVIDFAKNAGSWATARDVLALSSHNNLAASRTLVTASVPPDQQAGALTTGSVYGAGTRMTPSVTAADIPLPEPSSLALLAAGTLAMGMAKRKAKA